MSKQIMDIKYEKKNMNTGTYAFYAIAVAVYAITADAITPVYATTAAYAIAAADAYATAAYAIGTAAYTTAALATSSAVFPFFITSCDRTSLFVKNNYTDDASTLILLLFLFHVCHLLLQTHTYQGNDEPASCLTVLRH